MEEKKVIGLLKKGTEKYEEKKENFTLKSEGGFETGEALEIAAIAMLARLEQQ